MTVQQINRTLKDSENLPNFILREVFFQLQGQKSEAFTFKAVINALFYTSFISSAKMVDISCQPPVILRFLCLCISQSEAWLTILDISQLLM